MVARTELAWAYSSGKLATYQELGISHVEWLAVIDNRTCPRCAARNEQTFALADVDGQIPLHPRCRCTIVAAKGSYGKLGRVPGAETTSPGTSFPGGEVAAAFEALQGAYQPERPTASESDQADREEARKPAAEQEPAAAAPSRGEERNRALGPQESLHGDLKAGPPQYVHVKRYNAKSRSRQVRQFFADLAKVPRGLREALEKGGYVVHIVRGRLTDMPQFSHLVGVPTPDWGGKTWDVVPGAQEGTTVALAYGPTVDAHGSCSLALHEYAHAIDDYYHLSTSPEFLRAFNAEAPLREASLGTSYFNSPSEYAAETLAEYFKGRKFRVGLMEDYPQTYTWIRDWLKGIPK